VDKGFSPEQVRSEIARDQDLLGKFKGDLKDEYDLVQRRPDKALTESEQTQFIANQLAKYRANFAAHFDELNVLADRMPVTAPAAFTDDQRDELITAAAAGFALDQVAEYQTRQRMAMGRFLVSVLDDADVYSAGYSFSSSRVNIPALLGKMLEPYGVS
jgi:hypothetical protein